MFATMRRKDRQLSNSEAEEVLKSGAYGVLSMVGKNGYGYGIPLNYVYKNNSIFFHRFLWWGPAGVTVAGWRGDLIA
ncbi:MAG: pyridoxamine 5'-phosphate oxidase family protein [Acidimicrobiales bacterium]